jgi:acetyltransferase-like isoleucine patch superfamily enzyme
MKKYVKEALKELQDSSKRTVEIELKKKNDYKKNCFRLCYNKLILGLQTRIVPSHVKNILIRTTGVKVGHDVCIPHYISFDPYFSELINLGRGCLVGGDSNLITHEVRDGKLILGKCDVAERVLVGGGSTLLPGFKINKKSMLSIFSKCGEEIPEGELWAGKPAKILMQLTKDDIEKFFKPSNGETKEYYKEARGKIKEFNKDPSNTYLKLHYNGNRLNAGDDWWRARNFFRIWYNGVIIEITRLLPHCFLKTLLLKMVGVKIGKNCKIGKGTVFDHLYCDNVELEDNVLIGANCYLDGHEYTITQTVFGKTLLKKGVELKPHSFVRTGTTIGENTIIESDSMAQREIPANEVWAGVPAKFIKKND